ncbi:MAG: excinuclease ABC subunit B, partial [Saprospirales bacterium]
MVIFNADKITNSMQRTIDETNRRRAKQIAYNEEHGITPMTIFKSREDIMGQRSILDIKGGKKEAYVEGSAGTSVAADPILEYMTADQLKKLIEETERKMKEAAKEQDFMSAA